MKTIFPSLLAFGLSLAAHVAPAQRFLHSRPTTVAQLQQQAAAQAPAAGRRGTSTTVLRPGQVVQYEYDEANNTWVRPATIVFRYDAAGRRVQQTVRDSATNRPLNQTFFAYNAAGQLTERRYQEDQGTGAGWENTNLTLTTYNAAGLVTEVREHIAAPGSGSGSGSVWEDQSRELTTYDSRNELIEQQKQEFDRAPRTWRTTEGTRYLNTYDAGNFITAQVTQLYRPGTAAYADSVRYLYTRAATGEWTQATGQEPDGSGGWRNLDRTSNAVWFSYAQKQLTSADMEGWDGTQWQTIGRLRGTFTATSAEDILQEYDNGQYVNLSRQFYSYDANGNLLIALVAEWDGAAWMSLYELRGQYAYNPDQTLRRSIFLTDELLSGRRTGLLRNYSNYQPIALTSRAAAAAGTVQAYPNPSPDGRFTLQLSAPAAAGEVCVFDAQGRQVARQAWAGAVRRDYALDLSAQPAGLYTVRVQTAAGRVVQRLSIR